MVPVIHLFEPIFMTRVARKVKVGKVCKIIVRHGFACDLED